MDQKVRDKARGPARTLGCLLALLEALLLARPAWADGPPAPRAPARRKEHEQRFPHLAEPETATGASTWFSLGLLAGMPTALWLRLYPQFSQRYPLSIELFVGHPLGVSSRIHLEVVADDDQRHALFVSPGVSYVFFPAIKRLWGPERISGVSTAALDVDISYVWQQDLHFGLEFGLKLGGGVIFAGRDRRGSLVGDLTGTAVAVFGLVRI